MKKVTQFRLFFFLTYFFILLMLFFLQISQIPWFFLFLVLMHVGIVILIILKKRYSFLAIKPTYKKSYIAMGLFIPILIYKIIIKVIGETENEGLMLIFSFIAITIAVFIGIYNFFTFPKHNQQE
jgi:hypothetical protein